MTTKGRGSQFESNSNVDLGNILENEDEPESDEGKMIGNTVEKDLA